VIGLIAWYLLHLPGEVNEGSSLHSHASVCFISFSLFRFITAISCYKATCIEMELISIVAFFVFDPVICFYLIPWKSCLNTSSASRWAPITMELLELISWKYCYQPQGHLKTIGAPPWGVYCSYVTLRLIIILPRY